MIELHEVDGYYRITDPCYVYHDGVYDDLCEGRYVDGVLNFSTAYGDGGYPVYKDGKKFGHFGVDSGQFCLIKQHSGPEKGGSEPIIHLKGNLKYEDGNLYLNGKIVVDTSGEMDPFN